MLIGECRYLPSVVGRPEDGSSDQLFIVSHVVVRTMVDGRVVKCITVAQNYAYGRDKVMYSTAFALFGHISAPMYERNATKKKIKKNNSARIKQATLQYLNESDTWSHPSTLQHISNIYLQI